MASSAFHSIHQHTLTGSVTCSGIGLHTGVPIALSLHPADPDTGIVFRRLDVNQAYAIVPALYHQVVDTTLGTTIANAFGTRVSTIEHLMAALWGLGVDNALIELDGPEVPIMDGSSEPFAFLIECAGLRAQSSYRQTVEVLKKITVREGDSVTTIRPFDGFALSIEIDYDNAVVARHQTEYNFNEVSFQQTLCRARTFGFETDIAYLRSKGLARGGSLENAILVSDDRIINQEGLRYGDEFIRHKALDCVGDFFLAPTRLRAHISTYRPGHAINNKLLRAFFSDRTAWRFVSGSTFNAPMIPVQPELVVHHQRRA